jgi:hypothetical protein
MGSRERAMRFAVLVVLGTICVTACAEGAATSEGETEQPASSVDRANLPPPSDPGNKVPPVDGASPTPPGNGSDAGTVDAATPPIDSGPSPADACAAAIDISKSGTYPVDTCAKKFSLGATCATGGMGVGVALAGEAPNSGSTYQLSVPADWVVQQMSPTCSPLAFSCSPSGWGVSGYAGQKFWHFVVARADGTCGTTTVTVNRIQ